MTTAPGAAGKASCWSPPPRTSPGEFARPHPRWPGGRGKGRDHAGEADQLAAAHEAVAKVIEVDDFAPEALSPIYKKPADVHQFFQEIGEQRAAS